MDNYKIEKFKWGCMEDSIGCKIGNFQTEDNVIMLHKHLNKSVFGSINESFDATTRKDVC